MWSVGSGRGALILTTLDSSAPIASCCSPVVTVTLKKRQIRIGSRLSILAQIQSGLVLEQLKKRWPTLKAELFFFETAGDIDNEKPLEELSERGIFTKELSRQLIEAKIDAVVHSHKDLELKTEPQTKILSVLPRADQRDLLLLKRRILTIDTGQKKPLVIYTSSPRRVHNLSQFLPKALPRSLWGRPIQFAPIRGNIPTRLRKLQNSSAAGLVVAKAAIDRLLAVASAAISSAANIDILQKGSAEVRAILREMQCMVLPLSVNPTAAGQGALAVEVRRGEDWEPFFNCLTDFETTESVKRERDILSLFGGGCRQKIGISCLRRSYGWITYLCGAAQKELDEEQRRQLCHSYGLPPYLWPTKEVQQARGMREMKEVKEVKGVKEVKEVKGVKEVKEVRGMKEMQRTQRAKGELQLAWLEKLERKVVQRKEAWPLPGEDLQVERATFQSVTTAPPRHIWVSRKDAWPHSWGRAEGSIIWCSGIKTWLHLAAVDIWVHGSADGLGEEEKPALNLLLEEEPQFIKLTHQLEQQSQLQMHNRPPKDMSPKDRSPKDMSPKDRSLKDRLPMGKLQLASTVMRSMATYHLALQTGEQLNLSGKRYFYWKSASRFATVTQLFPEILSAQHACGPGFTRKYINRQLAKAPDIFLSYEDWLSSLT